MFHIFIIFFFIVYSICEISKYRKIESFKKKEKIYNKPVVYIKLISILITLILLIINRFLKVGMVDRSNRMFNSFMYFAIVDILVIISVIDYKKISKSETS